MKLRPHDLPLFGTFVIPLLLALTFSRVAAAAPVQARPESLLVMLGHFANTSCPCSSTAAARQSLFADPNQLDVQHYYMKTAHGGFSQFSVTVVDDIEVPLGTRCYNADWANYLDNMAWWQHGLDVTRFTHTMYVLPSAPNCGGGEGNGNSEIGGTRSFPTNCVLSAMAHELGHSFGMAHANQLSLEYGEMTDVMTRGQDARLVRELNAVHRLQLNWIDPARVVDVPSSGRYTLAALELDGVSVPQLLRIRRSSLDNDYLYVSYRDAIGPYDSGIFPATYIHRWDGGPTDLRSMLSDGQSFSETEQNGVVVRVQQISHANGSASLQIDLPSQTPPPPPPPSPACQSSLTTLCLLNRFKVSATYTVPGGTGPGTATAVSFSPNTALFWFFAPKNTELAIKVLDAGAGGFWVYYGGLTNLQYTITLTDTITGQIRTYTNPSGSTSGGRDVPFGSTVPSGGAPVIKAGPSVSPSSCTPDATTLCLIPESASGAAVDTFKSDGQLDGGERAGDRDRARRPAAAFGADR